MFIIIQIIPLKEKDPLKKEIKVSNKQIEIENILKTEIESNIKKGWEKVN